MGLKGEEINRVARMMGTLEDGERGTDFDTAINILEAAEVEPGRNTYGNGHSRVTKKRSKKKPTSRKKTTVAASPKGKTTIAIGKGKTVVSRELRHVKNLTKDDMVRLGKRWLIEIEIRQFGPAVKAAELGDIDKAIEEMGKTNLMVKLPM